MRRDDVRVAHHVLGWGRHGADLLAGERLHVAWEVLLLLEDVDLGLMAAGGALLGLLQMLDQNPHVDDGDVSDRFTARVLRALGIDADEADELCARPLPQLPSLS
ncbi:hypothetical protein [Nocardioides solisilvae]|uniref:hypothetical protein n=1 Tax=Nocardioides solisilvae TaxID=1542435 RepID=UPI0013A59A47|nr:hypothetical protein [Nocardioides solisilvae]